MARNRRARVLFWNGAALRDANKLVETVMIEGGGGGCYPFRSSRILLAHLGFEREIVDVFYLEERKGKSFRSLDFHLGLSWKKYRKIKDQNNPVHKQQRDFRYSYVTIEGHHQATKLLSIVTWRIPRI